MASLIIGQVILTGFVWSDQNDYHKDASFVGWLIGGIIPFLIVIGISSLIYPDKPIRENRTVVTEKFRFFHWVTRLKPVGHSFLVVGRSVHPRPTRVSEKPMMVALKPS